MATPSSLHARLFYRCAFQRIDEAEILRQANVVTAGPVYLAGYAVECILKALLLSSIPNALQVEMLRSFRGQRAHDYEWLRQKYVEHGGSHFPPGINRSFALLNDWS